MFYFFEEILCFIFKLLTKERDIINIIISVGTISVLCLLLVLNELYEY